MPSIIVAAVDRSPLSMRVVRHAIDLAKAMRSQLHFVFVKVPYGESFDKQTEDLRKRYVAEQIEALNASDLEVVHTTLESDVIAPTIINYAEDQGADLIVMGSHGRRGFRKFIMGSVALEVGRSSNCPVYTIGGKNETEAGYNPLSQILVPFDFSEDATRALEYATIMAESLNANIEVLHVVEDNFYPSFYSPFMHAVYESTKEIQQLAYDTLLKRVEQTGFDMDRVEITVIPGHPASEIARFAEDSTTDLIIMATHGLTGLRHLFMGSVAERTAQMATCPVLTLRMQPLELGTVPEMVLT